MAFCNTAESKSQRSSSCSDEVKEERDCNSIIAGESGTPFDLSCSSHAMVEDKTCYSKNITSQAIVALDLGATGGTPNETSDYDITTTEPNFESTKTASLESLNCPFQNDKDISKRKTRTLPFRRKKVTDKAKDNNKKRGRFWTFHLKKHLPVRLRKSKDHGLPEPTTQHIDPATCVCTGYRRTEDHVLGAGVVFSAKTSISSSCSASSSPVQAGALRQHRLSMGAGPGPSDLTNWDKLIPPPPKKTLPNNVLEMDLNHFNVDEYPCEDIDELRIAQRRRDMEHGIDLASGRSSGNNTNVNTVGIAAGFSGVNQGTGSYPHLHYSTSTSSSSTCSSSESSTTNEQIWNLGTSFQNQCLVTTTTFPGISTTPCGSDSNVGTQSITPLHLPTHQNTQVEEVAFSFPRTSYAHTQVDYIHCLVPDLLEITNCCFYWGVMDRYEAERLLENRPEGSFLLRDSAQEEFLFSVSFRRYGRSLHARIEQWNHKFSFDSHDPGVFATDTVRGLIEHYKDPSCCMFFEPMLTNPLNRSYPFSLQHLCRAVICGDTTYDGVNFLPLPKSLKEYLKYYHYKQKVRVRRFEMFK